MGNNPAGGFGAGLDRIYSDEVSAVIVAMPGSHTHNNESTHKLAATRPKGKTAPMIHQTRIPITTNGHNHLQDITQQVVEAVTASGVQTGLVHLFNIGSTAALGTIEFEPGLQDDFPEMLDRLIPPSTDYGHEQTWHDGNGHSHLQASLLGPSLTLPINDGQPVLGTWQQVMHVECDVKPRRREVVVTVIGE